MSETGLPETPGTVIETTSRDNDGSILGRERFVRLSDVETQGSAEGWQSLTDGMRWDDETVALAASWRVVSQPVAETLSVLRDRSTEMFIHGIPVLTVPHEALLEETWH